MILKTCEGMKKYGNHLFLSSANGECFYCNATLKDICGICGDVHDYSEAYCEMKYCNVCHKLAHENDNECPVWDGETATHNGILTLGQFLEIVKGLPLDTQIVTDDQNGWYWNVTSVQLPTNPDETGYMAITLNTANTFDARQF